MKSIEELYQEKSLTDNASYKQKAAKEKGQTSGYVAERDYSDYMIKESHNHSNSVTDSQKEEKRDVLTEFMVAPLYKRILFDRAPNIGMSENSDSKELFLRSRFIKGFADLKKYKQNLSQDSSGLRRVNGFEKVIAASLFLGEADYHDENIGVSVKEDGSHTAVKIDHGRSLWDISNSADELMTKFVGARKANQYEEIEFDISNFNRAVESINQISDDEIEGILRNQGHKVYSYGFYPTSEYYGGSIHTPITYDNESLEDNEVSLKVISTSKIAIKTKDNHDLFLEVIDRQVFITDTKGKADLIPDLSPKDIKLLSISIKKRGEGDTEEMKDRKIKILDILNERDIINERKYRLDNVERYMIFSMQSHKRNFHDLALKTEIIEKIDAGPEFKRGLWLKEIFSSIPSKDPILYAFDKGLTIEGKDPILWLVIKQKTIKKKAIDNFIKACISSNSEALLAYAEQADDISKPIYQGKSILDLVKANFSEEKIKLFEEIQNRKLKAKRDRALNYKEVPGISEEIKRLKISFSGGSATSKLTVKEINKGGSYLHKW